MTEEKKVAKKATHVTEAELWQLRALDAQQGRFQAEIQLLQQQGLEVQTKMQEFVDSLREKYGDAQVSPDGKLIYEQTPIPGVPNIPVAPAVKPGEDKSKED